MNVLKALMVVVMNASIQMVAMTVFVGVVTA